MSRHDETVITAPEGKFADSVLYFARLLRRAGIILGAAHVMDALRALDIAGFSSRQDLKTLLQACLVKRHEDAPVFEILFDKYWQRRGYLNQMMRVASPEAVSAAPQSPPKAGSARAADALYPNKNQAVKPQEQLELDARLTMTGDEVLRKRDFAQMRADELASALNMLTRLHLPHDMRRLRRYRQDARGQKLDVRKMLHHTLKSGGEMVILPRRAPREEPRSVVALCDISGSMQDYTRVFLHFLHTLTRQRRVETFLFGTRLTRVTRALKERDPDMALAGVSALVEDWSGGTQIGRCLEAFNKDWSRRVLGQGALVLLLTDGLERDEPERLKAAMGRLHKSCHRLVFLNPLLRYEQFAAKAQGIRAILSEVDELRPVHSLSSLAALCAAFDSRAPLEKLFLPKYWLEGEA